MKNQNGCQAEAGSVAESSSMASAVCANGSRHVITQWKVYSMD